MLKEIFKSSILLLSLLLLFFQIGEAIKYGSIKEVKGLIKNKINIEKKYEFEETALITASKNGYLKSVKLLVKNGANIEAKNKFQQTALIKASQSGHLNSC